MLKILNSLLPPWTYTNIGKIQISFTAPPKLRFSCALPALRQTFRKSGCSCSHPSPNAFLGENLHFPGSLTELGQISEKQISCVIDLYFSGPVPIVRSSLGTIFVFLAPPSSSQATCDDLRMVPTNSSLPVQANSTEIMICRIHGKSQMSWKPSENASCFSPPRCTLQLFG